MLTDLYGQDTNVPVNMAACQASLLLHTLFTCLSELVGMVVNDVRETFSGGVHSVSCCKLSAAPS